MIESRGFKAIIFRRRPFSPGIQDMVTKSLDANGDGKLDEKDFRTYVNRGLGMLSQASALRGHHM